MKLGVELCHSNGIDTILFDLDGTLRENNPSFNDAMMGFALQLGLTGESENRRQAHRWLHYYWAQSPELVSDLDTYEDYSEEFWTNHARLYLQAFGCQYEQASDLAPELTRCMVEEYDPEDGLVEEAPHLLGSLKEAGFRLAVVSNRRNPFDEQLENLGIHAYFEYTLAAGSINAYKPDPAVFHHALNEMGIEPDQGIYVGDNYFADVIGAQKARMQAVLIDPEGLFPEAECPIIDGLDELQMVLRD